MAAVNTEELGGLGDLFQTGEFLELDEAELQRRAGHSVEHGDPTWDGLTHDMMRSSCAFFASEVLQGPPQPPYNGRFLVADHHMEWDELIAKNDRVAVLAPRDHGKCQVRGASVLRADGKRVPIEEWAGGTVLAYDESTHKLVEAYAPPSRPNGDKPCLRITTKTGRRVEVTENHPLRLLLDWARADELRVGQRIAVPRRLKVSGKHDVVRAWLLGLLTGDGGLTGTTTTVTIADPTTVDAVRAAIPDGWHLRKIPKTDYDYALTAEWKREGSPRAWLREHGLLGHTSHTKRAPEALYTANESAIADFLAGYLDADGSVNPHGGGSVEYYSVSEDLLRDTQHLLTRLGVVSVLAPKRGAYKGAVHWSWRLTIRGADVLRFAAQVRPRGAKAAQLVGLAQAQEARGATTGPCVDRFPKEVWDLVEHSEDWFRKRGLPRPSKAHEPTRAKLCRIAQAESNAELLALTNSDVLWDEIVDIEDIGVQETWSMHVPGLVNYVADDVINHNTFFFDFAYPIWKASFLPGGKGYIFSATQDQAVRILDDIKEEIESNPKLAWLNPKTKSRNWSKTQITLANGHKIYARGYGTKIRGAHPDWIVVDDGLNDEDAYSELVRQKHIDYFYTAITNMCVPGGQIVVVGTPFHAADLYASLADNPRYAFRKYPALGPDGTALWPERYCATEKERKLLKQKGIVVESLENRKIEIGSVRFTREFLCEPISDDMSLFPEKLFRGAPTEVLHAKMGMPRAYYEQFGITAFFIGFDFAVSASTSADFTVGFVLGVDGMGNRWVIDIQRHKGLGYSQQKGLINALGRKYDPELIYLESNQLQRIFGDDLIRETDLPIFKFVTSGTKKNNNKQPTGNTHTMNKNTLEGGVPQLRVILENGKVRIPRGDKDSCEKSDIWVKEMKHFTWLEGKLQGVGSHDDTVMAFWIANCAIRAGAFSATFGPGEDDGKDLQEFLDTQMVEPTEDPSAEDPVAALLDAWDGDDEVEDILSDLLQQRAADTNKTVATLVDEALLDPDADAWKGLPGLGSLDYE